MNTPDVLIAASVILLIAVLWREQRRYRQQQTLLRHRFQREVDSYRSFPGPRPARSLSLSPEERRARAALYGAPKQIDVAPVAPPEKSARVADTTGRTTQERHISDERP